jgi:hypothetical protein
MVILNRKIFLRKNHIIPRNIKFPNHTNLSSSFQSLPGAREIIAQEKHWEARELKP